MIGSKDSKDLGNSKHSNSTPNLASTGIVRSQDSSSTFQWGSIGRSTLFDPFRRTRNLPFSIAGRRRSICVMITIYESNEADQNTAANDDKNPAN